MNGNKCNSKMSNMNCKCQPTHTHTHTYGHNVFINRKWKYKINNSNWCSLSERIMFKRKLHKREFWQPNQPKNYAKNQIVSPISFWLRLFFFFLIRKKKKNLIEWFNEIANHFMFDQQKIHGFLKKKVFHVPNLSTKPYISNWKCWFVTEMHKS